MTPSSERSMRARAYAHGLICDDVREEMLGTQTYVGVLGDQTKVQSFPGSFANLCFVGWFVLPLKDTPVRSVRVILEIPDGSELKTDQTMVDVDPMVVPGIRRRLVRAVVRYQFVQILREGWLRVYMEIDSRRWLAAETYVSKEPGIALALASTLTQAHTARKVD